MSLRSCNDAVSMAGSCGTENEYDYEGEVRRDG